MSNESPKLMPTESDIDRLVVEQAVLDADVALSRTRDLMLRLVELREQLATERAANVQLRNDVELAHARYDEIVGNRAYKTAAKVWALRRAIGV